MQISRVRHPVYTQNTAKSLHEHSAYDNSQSSEIFDQFKLKPSLVSYIFYTWKGQSLEKPMSKQFSINTRTDRSEL